METAGHSNTYITELITDFLTGNITEADTLLLKKMIEENPDVEQLFKEIRQTWDTSSEYISDEMETNRSWEKLNSLSIQSKNNNGNKRFIKLLKVAALWLALLATGSIVTLSLIKNTEKGKDNKMFTINTPLGSKTHMVLPDGSEVWLNAGTTMHYPGQFSTIQRDVFLSGEAYFKVATDKEWPFVVHTSELKINALGTAFNVKAYPLEKTVTATLVEGIIKIENDKQKFSYTLKPKQEMVFMKEKEIKNEVNKSKPVLNESNVMAKLNEDAIIKENVNTETIVSWKDNRWIISGESVRNLAIMLERRFNVKINIGSEELNEYNFSGIIENETIEQVLKYLSYTIPMKYEIRKGYVDLLIDNELKEKNRILLKRKPALE